MKLSEIMAAQGITAEASDLVAVEGLLSEKLTDTGNCERFIQEFGADLRWCPEQQRWFCWDGKRWVSNAGAADTVFLWTKESVRNLYRAALLESEEKQREAMKKWSHASESIKARKNIVEGSKSELTIDLEAFNADGWILNTSNGIFDLRNNKLLPHDRKAYCSRMAPVVYDPEAKAPKWEAFLERFQPDPEKRAFLQRSMGYACTGKIAEHVFIIFQGKGRNGKGTFISTMMKLLGDYGKQVPTELLVERKGQQNHLEKVTLFGVRFAAASETEEGEALATALVKNITGGDKISARYSHKDFFDFEPTHKIFLMTQHLPQVKETMMAIWARIRVVSWDVTIAEEEQDGSYADTLFQEEASGILNWVLEGCRAWQEHGLSAPASVMAFNNQYRENEDVVGQFLEAAAEIKPGLICPVTDLRGAYDTWSQSVGEPPLKGRIWNSRLETKGFKRQSVRVGKTETDYGKVVKCWTGLSLKGQIKTGSPVLEVIEGERKA